VRLATYDELTKPLLDYYDRTGRLRKVDGTGEIDEIYSQLDKLV
jgi:adenylate kinase